MFYNYFKKNNTVPQFLGNKYLDLFRFFIFYFIILTSISYLFRKKKYNKKHNKKYLFLTREWSESTTLIHEFKESLIESIDIEKILFLKLSKFEDISKSIADIVDKYAISHLIIDVRFMNVENTIMSKVNSLYKCRYISKILAVHNIVCFCGVTDWYPPGYRLLAGLLTSAGGVAFVYAGVNINKIPTFFHNRFAHPFYPPMSNNTLKKLDQYDLSSINNYSVAIIGSNYEPRKTIVLNLIKYLKKENISFFFYDKKDLTYIKYLAIYKKSKIVFNTNWVAADMNKYHCVGRNFEALITGSLLISQECVGLNYFFNEGEDYINFDSLKDLTNKITYYINNDNKRLLIATSGNKKAINLYNNGNYLKSINKNLDKFNLKEIN